MRREPLATKEGVGDTAPFVTRRGASEMIKAQARGLLDTPPKPSTTSSSQPPPATAQIRRAVLLHFARSSFWTGMNRMRDEAVSILDIIPNRFRRFRMQRKSLIWPTALASALLTAGGLAASPALA